MIFRIKTQDLKNYYTEPSGGKLFFVDIFSKIFLIVSLPEVVATFEFVEHVDVQVVQLVQRNLANEEAETTQDVGSHFYLALVRRPGLLYPANHLVTRRVDRCFSCLNQEPSYQKVTWYLVSTYKVISAFFLHRH